MEKIFMHKHILITGANGQLGQEFRSLISHRKGYDTSNHYFFTDRDTLDITNDKAVESYIVISQLIMSLIVQIRHHFVKQTVLIHREFMQNLNMREK